MIILLAISTDLSFFDKEKKKYKEIKLVLSDSAKEKKKIDKNIEQEEKEVIEKKPEVKESKPKKEKVVKKIPTENKKNENDEISEKESDEKPEEDSNNNEEDFKIDDDLESSLFSEETDEQESNEVASNDANVEIEDNRSVKNQFIPDIPDELKKLLNNSVKIDIQIEINKYGKVVSAKVLKSSGHSQIDELFIEAAYKWTFNYSNKDDIVKGIIHFVIKIN